ncbi:MAG: hypothetical protein HC828_03630 [Blastochloris sp.]|nr:hypothetical protein [Blastochloris sp.]
MTAGDTADTPKDTTMFLRSAAPPAVYDPLRWIVRSRLFYWHFSPWTRPHSFRYPTWLPDDVTDRVTRPNRLPVAMPPVVRRGLRRKRPTPLLRHPNGRPRIVTIIRAVDTSPYMLAIPRDVFTFVTYRGDMALLVADASILDDLDALPADTALLDGLALRKLTRRAVQHSRYHTDAVRRAWGRAGRSGDTTNRETRNRTLQYQGETFFCRTMPVSIGLSHIAHDYHLARRDFVPGANVLQG